MEQIKMSINGWLDNEDTVHKHMEFYSATKKSEIMKRSGKI